MPRIQVVIDFDYDAFRPYYEGAVKDVVAPSLDGRNIRFPASALRPYLTHDGIKGIFELQMNESNRLVSCTRIADFDS